MTRLISYLILLALFMPDQAFSQEDKQNSTINIGLLLPDTSHWWSMTNLKGFIDQANSSGGYQNKSFRLVVRTTDGPWGTGSKESVALVSEDHVCAILGLQDGRGAHLTEQVIAKTHVAYIECLATESTLSQAFVPFFFRMVPNDDQQAEAILELIKEKGGGKICILSTETYDARYAVRSLVKAAALKTGQSPLVIDVDSLEKDQNRIIHRMRSSGIKHLIIPFDSEENRDLLLALKKELPHVQAYGTLHFTTGAEIRKVPWRDYEGMYLVSVGPTWMGNKYLWGVSRISSISDALNLVIQAIREVGPEREAIIDFLAKSKANGYHTGPISFDEYGNRTRKPVFSKIQDGERVIHDFK